MKACALEEAVLKDLTVKTSRITPGPHHTRLLELFNEHLKDCAFQFALTQENWYRPGGVIRPDGTRVAGDLESWAETELSAHEGDMGALVELHMDDDLIATRFIGKMHYFTASYGQGSSDFLQLEVEEYQEAIDRRLIDSQNPPMDVSELIDPVKPHTLPFQTISRPAYRLRQLTDMHPAIARLTGPDEPAAPMQRFLDEWDSSRAGGDSHFSKHWVILLHEHTDCYRQTIMNAEPISAHARKLRYFHWEMDAQGIDLAHQLMHFDRVAGYPFAWYFHLVAGALTPHHIALKVKQDMEGGYGYLAQADLNVFHRWLETPYSI